MPDFNALQNFLSRGQRSDGFDPVKLAQLRQEQEDALKGNLEREAQFPKTYVAGGSPSELFTAHNDLKSDPFTGDAAQAQVEDTNHANLKAILSGFGGGTSIATSKGPDGQPDAAGYAAPPGDYVSPQARQARAGAGMEALKTQMPLAVEQEKTRGAMQVEQANFDRLQKLLQPPPTTQGSPDTAATPPPDVATPPKSQGWWDYLTGKGPNSASSALEMANERAKYGTMATPYSKLFQDVSFANLQQLSGQFPGVRGFSYLMPKLAEHQANAGKGETLAATYNRLKGMDQIMRETDQEFNDPSLRVGVGPDGRPRINMPPQTIARGKLALQDAHTKVLGAMQEIERLHPELRGGAPVGGGRGGGAGVPPGKVYLDDSGNPRR